MRRFDPLVHVIFEFLRFPERDLFRCVQIAAEPLIIGRQMFNRRRIHL